MSAECHPQTIEVVKTRAGALGIEVVVGEHGSFRFGEQVFGALVQYPNTFGEVLDYSGFIAQAHAAGALVVVAADLLSLTVLRPPGEFGGGLGGGQRAAIRGAAGLRRAARGLLCDARRIQAAYAGADCGGVARIRAGVRRCGWRSRRASNISGARRRRATFARRRRCWRAWRRCTRVITGRAGCGRSRERIHRLTAVLARGLERLGYQVGPKAFFDTVRVELGERGSGEIVKAAEARGMNFRVIGERAMGISLDETTTEKDVAEIWRVFNDGRAAGFAPSELAGEAEAGSPAPFARRSQYLTQPVFNRYHAETEMLRYMKRLEARDLSLTTSMIPLGSCTMKLNAAAEMMPVTWPEFGRLHPFAPLGQARGYQTIFRQVGGVAGGDYGVRGGVAAAQCRVAGGVCGAAGDSRLSRQSRARGTANVCLIPTSAHGTNPASAVMAGLKVVAVACDKEGNIDVADLRAKAEAHKARFGGVDGDVSFDARGVRGSHPGDLRDRACQRGAGVYGRGEPERASGAVPARATLGRTCAM